MEQYEKLLMMNASEYKSYHESFMADNHGSSAFHVFSCIFFTVQCTIYSSIKKKTFKQIEYVAEYCIIVLPMILAHTILSDYIYILNGLLTILLFFECMFYVMKLKNKFMLNNFFKTNRIWSISCMRSLTYLITVLCILAVDFKDFPRHLAKTEKYGYGLMDTGVGLFVLMSGLVHKDLNRKNYVVVIKGNGKFILILTLLGIARYVSVKQLDYQEHITEYGVHWNFFFTLAVCKLLSTILLVFTNRALFYSFVILIIHEYLLVNELEDWVFSNAPRDTFVSANREGVSSCLGYVSLYLFATYIKKALADDSVRRYIIQMKLVVGSIFLWILLYCINIIRPTSRVLANAGYCLFMETLLVTVLAVLYFFEVLFQCKGGQNFSLPTILASINTNGLSYFLIANLSTGIVNLSVRTLFVSSHYTFVILNMYMIFTLAFTEFLKRKRIKI